MCSATQKGFLVRRSKEEIRELRVARSATGPGKPYWKSPAGSTGAVMARAPGKGTGAGRTADEVGEGGVESTGVGLVFLSGVGLASDMLAAVTAAPVAALTAAMIANVVFDIVKEGEGPGLGGAGYIYEMKRTRQSRSPDSQSGRQICRRVVLVSFEGCWAHTGTRWSSGWLLLCVGRRGAGWCRG